MFSTGSMLNESKYEQPPCTPAVDFSKTIDPSVLNDQSILVTGGAAGIAEAFVEAVAKAGAYVTFIDISNEQGTAVAERLSEKGHRVQFVHGDVRSWDDQIKAFDAAVAFSPAHALDIVLVVAGVTGSHILEWLNKPTLPDGHPVKPDPKCLDINLAAPWYTTHLALHYFRQSLQKETRSVASKQIVFVSSMAAYAENAGVTDYAGSKWGIRGIWRNIRSASGLLGDDTKVRFRSSMIAPWFIKTAMTAPFMQLLAEIGVPYAEPDVCADAMLRIVCDEEVDGRAIAVLPNGNSFDLCDDFDGLYAGKEFNDKATNGAYGRNLFEILQFCERLAKEYISQATKAQQQ